MELTDQPNTSPGPPDDPPDEGIVFLKEAAELLLNCATYMDRLDAEREGGKTYYAIDADVVVMYLKPFEQWSYGQVFESDSPDTAGLLSCLLGDFLLAETHRQKIGSQGAGLLIAPSHGLEVLSNVARAHDVMAGTQHGLPASLPRLEAIWAAYGKDHDERKLLKTLVESVPELVELYSPLQGSLAIIERFRALPADAFRPLGTIRGAGPDQIPLLDPAFDPDDRKTAEGLESYWKWLLKRVNRNKPDISQKRDAEALAAIEYANTHMTDGRRLVLITGSETIFAAANLWRESQYRSRHDDYLDDWSQDESRSVTETCFADRYLTRPVGLLADARFFANMQYDDQESVASRRMKHLFKTGGWLASLYPALLEQRVSPESNIDRQRLGAYARGDDLDKFSGEMDVVAWKDLRRDWKRHLELTVANRYPVTKEQARERGAKQLLAVIESVEQANLWDPAKLERRINARISTIISSLFSEAGWFGIWNESEPAERTSVTPVRCREVPGFEALCADIVAYQGSSNHRSEQATSGLPVIGMRARQVPSVSQLRAEIEGLVGSPAYFTQVAHALAFMSKGYWRAAIAVANAALEGCDNMPPAERESQLVDGREAAFLACVASRRCAALPSDLKRAADYLSVAIRRGNRSARGIVDVRFKAETCALRARAVYFSQFVQSHAYIDGPLVLKIVSRIAGVLELAERESRSDIQRWVRREVITDYFMLVFILSSRDPQHEPDRGEQRQLLHLLDQTLKADEQEDWVRADDRFGYLVRDVATAHLASSDKSSASAGRDALAAIHTYGRPARPWDARRLKFLEEFVNAILSRT